MDLDWQERVHKNSPNAGKLWEVTDFDAYMSSFIKLNRGGLGSNLWFRLDKNKCESLKYKL